MCLVTKSCPTLCDPMNSSSPGSSVHGDSPGKNTGVGCHFHLQPQSTVRFQLHHQSGKKEGRKHSSCSFWQRTPVNKASLWPTCGISGKPMAWPLGNWEVRAQQGCNGHFPLKGVCPERVSSAPGLLTVTSQNIHLVRVTFTRIRHTFFRGGWKVPFRYNTIYSTTLSFSLMQSSIKLKKKKKNQHNYHLPFACLELIINCILLLNISFFQQKHAKCY